MPTDSQARQPENPPRTDGEFGSGKRSRKGNYPQSKASYLPDIHRSLPQSLDAEKGVLCSALLSPGNVLGECIERLEENHFYHPAHQIIYREMVMLQNAAKPVDFITLTQVLKDKGELDKAGGAAAISELFTFVPTSSNADYYIDIVREKFLLRQLITTCTEFASRAYDEQGEVKLLLDEAESKVMQIGEERFKGVFADMRTEVMKAIESIEALYKNRGGLTGLPTGFKKLDEMTGGLRGSEMFVVAARPSMGKTAFAMNIAEHVAVVAGKPVGVFSLEMSASQLVQRLLCSHARVNLKNVRDGFLSTHDTSKITKSAQVLAKSSIYIDETAGISILELRAKARRMRDRHGIELIVIDYLQLLRSPSKRGQENRQIEIAEISNGVKALAKELDIPIIVLAQLNRNPDSRTGNSKGRPRMSDLRESGSIEQDADVVSLLVRSEVYEDDEDEKKEKAGEAELIIAKQRNGPIGDIPLSFLKEFTRFEDRAEVREGGGD
ncbi:MAG TPA: replicative DNA helicase [Chthoniobacterales bacterium]|nr:replicative DNA helicase [Chthoniobacterales bacterium]